MQSLIATVFVMFLASLVQCQWYPCHERPCQVSQWSPWSRCPQNCAHTGIQKRTRFKTVHEQCGGACPYNFLQIRPCWMREKCQNRGTPLFGGGKDIGNERPTHHGSTDDDSTSGSSTSGLSRDSIVTISCCSLAGVVAIAIAAYKCNCNWIFYNHSTHAQGTRDPPGREGSNGDPNVIVHCGNRQSINNGSTPKKDQNPRHPFSVNDDPPPYYG